MRAIRHAALAAIAIGLPAVSSVARADDRYPMMDHDRPVVCARDKDGEVWRIQCDPTTKVCLYAADDELDADGNRTKPLERTRQCASETEFDRAKFEADGYHMLAGRADAPWGWTRDERGRVFQINFDLKRRLYFGVGWTPQKILDHLDDPLENKRSKLDFGLFIFEHYTGGKNATRHRIRLLEGEVRVEPFSSEVVVAHYDLSHRFVDPLLRITTFVGEPQRHDLVLNLGLWTEAGGLEIHPTPTGHSSIWKHATAEITLDIWQSRKLDSYARFRTGFGLEGQRTDDVGYRSALTSASAFELDCVLDPAGFHNLKLEVSHEMPRYFSPVVQGGQKLALRTKAKLQYEAIVLAINDQPLTFALGAGGEKRNDIMGVPDRWAFVMDAGLRFSLWAPPRPRS
ncbi:MAG: hypothetical protein HOV81_06930 [Kofleriaceae bacterium]|nr:hypothetical protein [Kofleriaceae bacterium]